MSRVQFIRHRVNEISALEGVHSEHGVEIDLRSDVCQAGSLHLSHDPWKRGDALDAWLDRFKRLGIAGPILLNTKEDGLEDRVMEELARFEITDYLLLDTTVPTLVKLVEAGLGRHCMLRLSSYEPVEMVKKFAGEVSWLWIDCFHGKPLAAQELAALKTSFRICLVSPELHGLPLEEIRQFCDLVRYADAVCTKRPEQWSFTRRQPS